jgi:hypothetical protein
MPVEKTSAIPIAVVMEQQATRAGRIEISTNQAVAYVVGVPCVCLGPMIYWQYGAALFGPNGFQNLLLLAGIGGAVSFGFYAGAKRWLVGTVLGLMAGLGAAGLHVFYTGYFQKTSMLDKESALVSLAGAAPSMILLAFILKRDKAAATKATDGEIVAAGGLQ